MARISVNTGLNSIYGKGDVCLKLSPFDNYRKFILYENWLTDDRKPLDLSNEGKAYLVFKSKKKEIRIPEFDLTGSSYKVDKVNGEVLFKIDKKNAIDILSMESNTFYITVCYGLDDERNISSEEEVMYVGKWKSEESNTESDYSSTVRTLTNLVTSRNESNKTLQESNTKLINQNVELVSQVESLQNTISQYEDRIAELESKLAEYESGTVYSGTVMGKAKEYTIISEKEYTEAQMQAAIKSLQSTTKK